jgi:adenylate cyclase
MMSAAPQFGQPQNTADKSVQNVKLRSSLLRIAASVMLGATLWVDEHQNLIVHAIVVATYCSFATFLLILTLLKRAPLWLYEPLVIIDATLVVILFHEYIIGGTPREQDLTAANISVAFILLLHAALSLQPRIVLVFSGTLLGGWLGFAVTALVVDGGNFSAMSVILRLRLDAILAVVFMLAIFMVLMLIKDHNSSLARAVAAERQRSNLQRFFAPDVAVEIAQKGLSLGLGERQASIMFVDLRTFTRFAESATSTELASILSEFRAIVSDCVFAHGGTIDKFIGDAVLAVFGVPIASPNDKANALACSQILAHELSQWEGRCLAAGKPALKAGIGLHHGTVLFGVITSGRHSELTVLGDVVNIAQRLEHATKALDALVVASDAFSSEVRGVHRAADWCQHSDLSLLGREQPIGAYFLPRSVLARHDAAISTRIAPSD